MNHVHQTRTAHRSTAITFPRVLSEEESLAFFERDGELRATWHSRLHSLFFMARPWKMSSFGSILGRFQLDVKRLGFQPMRKMLWGIPPILSNTPSYVALNGATVLQSYVRSNNIYLKTTLSDGVEIQHTTRAGGGKNKGAIYYMIEGNFESAYHEHLAVVARYCQEHGVRPLFMGSDYVMIASYRYFVLARISAMMTLEILMVYAQIGFVLWMVLSGQ